MNRGNNYAELLYSDMVNDIDTFEKNVKDYPVSSVARFLFLYHHKKNNDPDFDKLARQSGIYFNNPYWIQYQLSQTGSDNLPEENEKHFATSIPEEVIIPEAVNQQITQNPVSEIDTVDKENKEELSNEENSNEKEQNISDSVNEQITQNPVSEIDTVDKVDKEELSNEENSNEKEQNISDSVNEQITQNPVSEIDTADEEHKEDLSNEINLNEKEQNISDAVNQQITQNPVSEINIADERNKEEILNPENSNEKEQNVPEPVNQQIIQNPVLEMDTSEEENKEESLAFEPLHTVDYFASQGIKITEEALENDHLGQQVKSFTAWLKSMKRLHPGQIPEQNEVIEKIIQASAEASNQSADVLTEAMAEVLMKQNKREKAIEMYQKLSLINPSKSAYFAAKIESLKII